MGEIGDGIGVENGSTKEQKVATTSISMPPPPPMAPKKQSSQPKASSEAIAMPPPPPIELIKKEENENNDVGTNGAMPPPLPVAKPQQKRLVKEEKEDNDKGRREQEKEKEEGKEEEKEKERKASTAPVGGTGIGGINSYVPPKGATRPRHEFALEVIKEGSIIATLPVHAKDHYVFGRHERCDFVIEHPSASRLHAVLQYREAPSGNGETEAFIFDMGSTHGTVVNKQQVKPNVFVPLTVGSIIKFGQSTRLYIFQGPTELMPEEGLSRAERRALRQLEAAEEARIRAESLARAALDASREREVTWGMGEDAEDDQEADTEVEEVTWETYKGELTDKQQALKDKIYKRQQKLNNMRTEIDRIQAKEAAQSGLTPGQAAQIARNDQRMQQIMEELESMEETLNDSIRESLGAKTRNALGIKSRTKTKKKPGDESEDESASDDDDFYDRASTRGKAKGKKGKGVAKVETAETIWAQLHALENERRETEARLEEELAKEANKPDQQQQQQPSSTADDALDAFMTDVAHQIEADGVSRVRHKLAELAAEEARLRKLLKIADPDGLYVPKAQPSEPAPSASNQQQGSSSPKQAQTVVQSGVKSEAPAVSTDTATVKPAVWNGDAPGLRAPENHDVVTAVTTAAHASAPHAEGNEAEAPTTASDTTTTTLEAAVNALVPNQAKWLGVGAPKAPSEERHDHHPQVDLAAHDEKHDGGFVDRKALLEVRGKKKQKLEDELEKGLSELPPDVSADAAVAEKVALLLRHSYGLTPTDDEDEDESMMSPASRKRKADASHTSPAPASKKASKSAGAEKSNESGRRVYGPARPPQGPDAVPKEEEDEAPWVPPVGQTGDGRTKLNDMLGY